MTFRDFGVFWRRTRGALRFHEQHLTHNPLIKNSYTARLQKDLDLRKCLAVHPAHEVTTVGNDRTQLAPMAKAAKAALKLDKLEAIADRGYFNGSQILTVIKQKSRQLFRAQRLLATARRACL